MCDLEPFSEIRSHIKHTYMEEYIHETSYTLHIFDPAKENMALMH